MGNRAIITNNQKEVGIYLHWNGSPSSVASFCAAAKQLNVRGPNDDPSYCFARMAQIIGNFLGGTTSLGCGATSDMDDGDNGMYVIDNDFNVVDRVAVPDQEIVAELVRINKPFFVKG